MATIITKNSSTASSVPLNTQLVQGELAVNVTDKRLFTENASGTVVELGTNPSTLVTSNTFLAFGRGNTEDMRLTSTGLGIGTSSPGAVLHTVKTAAGAASIGGILQNADNSLNSEVRLLFAPNLSTNWGNRQAYISGVNVVAGGTATELAFGTASNGAAPVERLRLDASGNLGLGVTPSAWGGSSKILQILNAAFRGAGNSAYVGANYYFDGSNNRYIASAAASLYEQDAGRHIFYTAPSGTAGNAITFTQAMTLDASGRLGIATTSPNRRLDIRGTDTWVKIAENGVASWLIGTGTTNALRFFDENASERARIDSSGNFIVSATANVNSGIQLAPSGAGAFGNNAGVSGFGFITFYRSNTAIGNIAQSGTTAVAYNTTSDYRLKENVQPMTGALAKVAALKPCTYKWKADGSDGEGFIAHELQEVVPQCVTGEKDAVDAEGKPVYQGIDTSFLVATLTAAIQELKASLDEVKLEFDAYKAEHP